MKNAAIVALLVGSGLFAGCAGRPSLLPNSDPNLNRTAAQFAADAAKRHPYKADAPRGGDAPGTAEYNLTFGTLQILNYGDQDWDNVEVWVNRNYCCWLPKIDKNKVQVKTINFTMLYDDSGNSFETDGGKNPLKVVEIYRNGKMYNIPIKLAD